MSDNVCFMSTACSKEERQACFGVDNVILILILVAPRPCLPSFITQLQKEAAARTILTFYARRKMRAMIQKSPMGADQRALEVAKLAVKTAANLKEDSSLRISDGILSESMFTTPSDEVVEAARVLTEMRKKDIRLGGVRSFPSKKTLQQLFLLRKAVAKNDYSPTLESQYVVLFCNLSFCLQPQLSCLSVTLCSAF